MFGWIPLFAIMIPTMPSFGTHLQLNIENRDSTNPDVSKIAMA